METKQGVQEEPHLACGPWVGLAIQGGKVFYAVFAHVIHPSGLVGTKQSAGTPLKGHCNCLQQEQ